MLIRDPESGFLLGTDHMGTLSLSGTEIPDSQMESFSVLRHLFRYISTGQLPDLVACQASKPRIKSHHCRKLQKRAGVENRDL